MRLNSSGDYKKQIKLGWLISQIQCSFMSQTPQVALSSLKEWMLRETAQTIEPLKEEGERLLTEIKERLDEAIKACERLTEKSEKETQKGSPKTYRRAKLTYKFSRNMAETIRSVVVPGQLSYDNLQSLYADLEKMQATIDQERRRWYPYISPYFILDRRWLDTHLKRTADILQELRNFLTQKYAKAKTVDEALAEVDRLLESLKGAEENKRRIDQTEIREESLEKKIAKNKQKATLIQGKVELEELVKINQKTEELRKNVKHNLRHLQKPFVKLKNLGQGARVTLPLDEAKKLSDYLNDPLEALAVEEEGHPMLRQILRRVEDAINGDKLKLKSSRLRKAQTQIDKILNRNMLIPLQQSCAQAYALKKKLQTSETVTSSKKELAHLQNEERGLQRHKEIVASRKTALINERKRLQDKIEQEKEELDEMVLQLTGKTIQIILD